MPVRLREKHFYEGFCGIVVLNLHIPFFLKKMSLQNFVNTSIVAVEFNIRPYSKYLLCFSTGLTRPSKMEFDI